jgi:putative ATPase
VTKEGTGYVYPHADPAGWVAQQHRPDEVEGRRYYRPTTHGREADLAERIGDEGDEPRRPW